MIGAVLSFGHKVHLTTLTAGERSRATEVGFSYYCAGEQGVIEALDEIRSRISGRAVQASHFTYYGRIYEWLDRHGQLINPGPIKRIVRDHILSTNAIGQGERLLGEVVSERRMHSLGSLSETTGIPRRRLSRLFQKLGLVPQGMSDAESGLLLFPVAKAEELCRDFETAIALEGMADYIGASARQAQALYLGGIIAPLVPPTGPGSVRNILFSLAGLDAFLMRLEQIPLIESSFENASVSLAVACQRVGVMSVDLVKAILENEVPAWRCADKSGLRALRVRLDDVRSLRLRIHSA